jgi:hypothetical protein
MFYFVAQSTFMKTHKEPIEQLKEIHSMMERSSRFISLSGLSGISAGIIALAGAAYVFITSGTDPYGIHDGPLFDLSPRFTLGQDIVICAVIVLILALASGIFFTTRRARKNGQKIWDQTSRRLVINLALPLISGGLFCLILMWHQIVFLVAPATLIFYGLALINASKYTLDEIKVLGISEIILGLIGAALPGYGLLLWALGFGILHIFYGALMYVKYEKNEER